MTRTTKHNDTPEPELADARNDVAPAKPPRKITQVLQLLRREHGATLGELVEATGWQPHTARAALTGLRKKGHVLAKFSRDDTTCYRVEA